MKDNAKLITVAGKGGVGKTSVAAAMVKIISQTFPEKRLLAIDADPATGLSTALGVEVKATIDDIRKDIVSTLKRGIRAALWSFWATRAIRFSTR